MRVRTAVVSALSVLCLIGSWVYFNAAEIETQKEMLLPVFFLLLAIGQVFFVGLWIGVETADYVKNLPDVRSVIAHGETAYVIFWRDGGNYFAVVEKIHSPGKRIFCRVDDIALVPADSVHPIPKLFLCDKSRAGALEFHLIARSAISR